MNKIFQRSSVSCILVLMVLLAGCAATKASRFYTLSSMTDRSALQEPVKTSDSAVIAIGPVDIPDILKRPQIVLYSGSNEIVFSEFDRWAGSLKEDISSVLIEDLSMTFYSDGISVVSWRQPLPADYRISLSFGKFGSTVDNEVRLSARWSLFEGSGRKALYISESSVREPVDGHGHPAVVAAMSRALERLSLEVAGEIRRLIK